MPNPFLDSDTGSSSKNPFLDAPASSSKKLTSDIDASLPTVKSTLTGDAAAMQNLGADEPGYEYDDIFPLKKNIKTGERSLALPEMIKSPIRGMGDLISQAQKKSTDASPDAIAAMMTMGGAYKPTGNVAGKVIDTVSGKTRGMINTVSDTMAKKVPIDKEHAQIIKILTKDGRSPEEIVDIMKKAKETGMTIGEASGNPKLLGLERKISGLNQPGGMMVRDFVKDRVDPNNNVSMPYKLKSIADPLVKTVDDASKQIGKITESAPKTPIAATSIESSLAREARPPKSMVTNTLDRIDGLMDWAKSQGGTFADYHRVKQEIYNLKTEAKDPSAVEKLDGKTINKYYKQVNDLLSGKSPGLPQDLQDTAKAYRSANDTFSKNLAGRTIQETLDKMPAGGTPASKLKYLHKQLAGNAELQEELFSGMPENQRPGMIKLLKAIEESSRSGATDVVKSMEEGSPTFPFSKSSALHKMFNAVADAMTRKDYDALAKALTSPDAELVAKKLGYVEPPQSPITGNLSVNPMNTGTPLQNVIPQIEP